MLQGKPTSLLNRDLLPTEAMPHAMMVLNDPLVDSHLNHMP